MPATTHNQHVRISQASHRKLRELADETGESMTAVLDQAIERFRRERFFARAAAEWEAIQRDPIARAELDAEYALWDTTVADGLDGEEW
ncbi:MAG TPA: hypothetical protein VMM78_16895 [Thermomicrobiales bacterium]|nr:hypothetical protein [Thermomicrobiales bacterium]